MGEHGTLIGRNLGDFVVLQQIGQGGFGSIYRATQTTLQREAVIKVLRADVALDPSATPRFMREAQLLTRLDHPYAAHVYAFGVEPDGLLWIAMELVRGTPLSTLIEERGPIPLRRFAPLFEKLCEVVHSAHEHGIIHRDIKPANIMVLSRAGRLLPKLLDLGIAKFVTGPEERPADFSSPGRSAPPLTREEQRRIAVADTLNQLNDTLSASGATPAPDVSPGETLPGRWIGSPTYMPPEVWSFLPVDARADIYALGLVAFEALAGRPAFQGTTLHALAQDHLLTPIALLGPAFPAGLNEVLRRATAKTREERYSTALELAADFRAACDMAREETRVPRLTASLVERWSREAPRPLADAILLLDAARTVHQARDALWGVVRAAAHYTGVVALRCHERAAPRPNDPKAPIQTATKALRDKELDEAEWIAIAIATCLPYAGRPELHPIPELCALFNAPPDGEVSVFDELLAARGPARTQASEEAVRELCARCLPLVERLLGQLSFLLHYALVVGRGGAVERWMGPRSSHATMSLSQLDLPDGHAALVDPQGEPVLELWPLVQPAQPAPGAAEEIFLFAGRVRGGAMLVAVPHGFERRDDAVWDWLRERLFIGEESGAERRSDEDRPPYLGLAAFGAGDSDLFLGREREVLVATNTLRQKPFFAVVGASGAGKSSFVQAGVIPALPDGWRAVGLRPGPSPLSALANALTAAGLSSDAAALRAEIAADPDALARCLHAPRSWDVTVLVIDQLEELFTLCLDPGERAAFAESLSRAARTPADPARVIVTLRDDFLVRAEHLRALTTRLSESLYVLTMPEPADLERIVVAPARRRGYEFDDPELPSAMVAEVADKPGALALLSFTAAKLWDLRDTLARKLRRATYEAMGGVGGALAAHAEEVLASMLPEERRLTREAFRRLVTSEGTREVLERGELLEVLGKGERAEAVIDKLVGARLLVASEGEGGAPRVEIIHEALLGAWPRLVDWRREDQEGARLRDQLRAAARQWDERGRPRGILWQDDALSEYKLWKSRFPMALTQVEEAFGAASLAEEARKRRARTGVVAGAFVILAVAALLLWSLYSKSERERIQADAAREDARANQQKAEQVVTEQYVEHGRLALLRGDHARALVYLAEAYKRGADGPGMRFMLARAGQVFGKALMSVNACGGSIHRIAYSPDGTEFATVGKDCPVRIWDARTGRLVRALDDETTTGYFSAQWSADGTRLVAWFRAHTRVYEARTWKLLYEVEGCAGDRCAALSADGRVLVTGDLKGLRAQLWNVATGAPLVTLSTRKDFGGVVTSPTSAIVAMLESDSTTMTTIRLLTIPEGRQLAELLMQGELLTIAWSPDGKRLAAGDTEGRLIVWDVSAGRELFRAARHKGYIEAIAWSASGRRLAVAAMDGLASVWDAESGTLQVMLEGHLGSVRGAAFSPDETRVVTSSDDGTAAVWDATSGRLLSRLTGHSTFVRSVVFSPDGSQVVTGASDGMLKLWDPRPDDLLHSFPHPGPVNQGFFLPGGERVLTSTGDGRIWLWDARSGALLPAISELASVPTGVLTDSVAMSASHDGKRLLMVRGGVPSVVSFETGAVLLSLAGRASAVYRSTFSPDDQRITTSSSNSPAKIWDARTGESLLTLKGDVIAWSADGDRIVTTPDNGLMKVCDSHTGRELASMAGLRWGVNSAHFSPDGAFVISAGSDKIVRIWDSRSGALVRALEGHEGNLNDASPSPDGSFVASASADRTVKIWDIATGKELYSYPHDNLLMSVRWSPDGRRLISSGDDKTAKIWDVSLETRTPDEVAKFVACHVPFALKDGLLTPTTPACP